MRRSPKGILAQASQGQGMLQRLGSLLHRPTVLSAMRRVFI